MTADSLLQGLRILVVEDEFLVARDLKNWLEESGGNVVGPAPSLRQATELADGNRLDGAILDVNLHGETIGLLAGQLRERGIPFIIVTGYEREALEPGLRNVPRLTKPFSRGKLLKLARSVFRRGA